MKMNGKTIYTALMLLLGLEMAVMIISILSKPLSDAYLRFWGILALLTAIPAAVLRLRRR